MILKRYSYLLLIVLMTFAAGEYVLGQCVSDSMKVLLKSRPSDADLRIQLSLQTDLSISERMCFAEEAIRIADESKDVELEVSSRIQLALLYRLKSEYRKAFEEYGEIKKLCQESRNDSLLGEAYYLVGVLHKELNQTNLAEENLQQAISLLSLVNHKHALGNSYHSYGSLLYEKGFTSAALQHYHKAAKLVEDRAQMLVAPLNSLGLHFLENQQYDSAFYYFNKGRRLSDSIDHYESHAIFCNNLGITLFELGRHDEAKVCFDSAYASSIDMQSELLLPMVYSSYAEYYAFKGDFENAYGYKIRELRVKDSISGYAKRNQVNALLKECEMREKEKQVGFVQERVNRLLLDKHMQHSIVLILILLLMLLVIFIVVVLHKHRRKMHLSMRKQTESMLISEARIRNNHNEMEALKESVDKLEEELFAKGRVAEQLGLELSVYLNTLADLRVLLKQALPKDLPSKQLMQIRQIVETQYLNRNKEVNVHNAIKESEIDFNSRLIRIYPGLTRKELQLCSFIFLEMSNKEIAMHNGTSVKAVEMARYRIRKKMCLQSGERLFEVIKNI